jgi:hypothetical protein
MRPVQENERLITNDTAQEMLALDELNLIIPHNLALDLKHNSAREMLDSVCSDVVLSK